MIGRVFDHGGLRKRTRRTFTASPSGQTNRGCPTAAKVQKSIAVSEVIVQTWPFCFVSVNIYGGGRVAAGGGGGGGGVLV